MASSTANPWAISTIRHGAGKRLVMLATPMCLAFSAIVARCGTCALAPRRQLARCNPWPRANSGFSFASRGYLWRGGDTPLQGRDNVLLDSTYPTWNTSVDPQVERRVLSATQRTLSQCYG